MSDRITAEEAQRLLDDGSPGWGGRLESAALALAAEVVRLSAERDELRQVVERVRGWHRQDPDEPRLCVSCSESWPCTTWLELGGDESGGAS